MPPLLIGTCPLIAPKSSSLVLAIVPSIFISLPALISRPSPSSRLTVTLFVPSVLDKPEPTKMPVTALEANAAWSSTS